MAHMQRVLTILSNFIGGGFVIACIRRERPEFGQKRHRTAGMGVATAAALMLSGCIESQVPLLTDAHPLLGLAFQANVYEDFVDGKASDFHSSIYGWKDGQYVRASRLARDVKHLVAQPMTETDYLIQITDEDEKVFDYFIGRKIVDGAFVIFALDEADVDDATRTAACAKDQPAGVCQIQTFDQLAMFARATSAKPVRNPTLAVIVAK